MSVRKHKKFAVYVADYRDAFGVRRQPHFPTKAAARAHEAEQLRLARQGLAPQLDPDITLAEYVKAVWPERRKGQDIDPGTTSRQEVDLRRHILPVFGDDPFRQISRQRVRRFLLAKMGQASAQGLGREGHERRGEEKTLSRGSVLNIHHTLSAILSEALEDQLIHSNPVRGLWQSLSKGKASKVKRAGRKIKALDVDQAPRFYAAALEHTPGDYLYFLLLGGAGLRPAEGLGVIPGKADLTATGPTGAPAPKLLVDVQVTQHPDRSGKHQKDPKDVEPRWVDLSAPLVAAFRARVAELRSETFAAGAGERTTGAIAAAETGGRARAARPAGPWLCYPELGPNPTRQDVSRVYTNAQRAMRRALERAGLPTHFSLHSLRHTFGSHLIRAGFSPAYVQQQMGHASIQMTVDTYGSWLPVEAPGAVDRLARTLLGAGENAAILQQLDTKTGERG